MLTYPYLDSKVGTTLLVHAKTATGVQDASGHAAVGEDAEGGAVEKVEPRYAADGAFKGMFPTRPRKVAILLMKLAR